MSIPVTVALVDESGHYHPQDLAEISGGLNEHLQHDVARAWPEVRSATVIAYQKAPPNTWAIKIQKKLDEPGALGYHTDNHGQPISYVEYTGADTTVTISHELNEMLVDPLGSLMHGGRIPQDISDYKQFGLQHASSHVQYLLEVCDPCEAGNYEVGGVLVSDFLYPDWYRTNPPAHPHYSAKGTCKRPREVADGGYVSFMNPTTEEWYQVFVEGTKPEISDLGKFDKTAHGSVREWTDLMSRAYRQGGRDLVAKMRQSV